MLLVILLAITIVCMVEGFPLYGKKQWKELATLGLLLGIALLLGIGYKLGIQGPIALMDEWLNPLGKAIFQ